MQFLKDHPNLNRLIDRATTKARVAQNPQYSHSERDEAYGLLRVELIEQKEAIKWLLDKIIDLAAEIDSLENALEYEDE